MSPLPDPTSSDEPEIPRALKTALRGLERERTSDSTDERVLSAARDQFDRLEDRPRPRPTRHWLRPVGIAAAAALVLAIFWVGRPPRNSASPYDVDQSGEVDVLDAYLLARGTKTGFAKDLALENSESVAVDVTGDGVVDQRDVDAVLSEVVRL